MSTILLLGNKLYRPMAHWLLLITNLPGRNQTLRMRLWRALKASGSVSLRDGVYLLPASQSAHRAFDSQALEIQSGHGSAYILPIETESAAQHQAFQALFDRAIDYQEIMKRLSEFRRKLAKLNELTA